MKTKEAIQNLTYTVITWAVIIGVVLAWVGWSNRPPTPEETAYSHRVEVLQGKIEALSDDKDLLGSAVAAENNELNADDTELNQ